MEFRRISSIEVQRVAPLRGPKDINSMEKLKVNSELQNNGLTLKILGFGYTVVPVQVRPGAPLPILSNTYTDSLNSGLSSTLDIKPHQSRSSGATMVANFPLTFLLRNPKYISILFSTLGER